MNRRESLAAIVGATWGWVTTARAQTSDTAATRWIVPTPAGGPSDVAARAVAQAWSKSSGTSVVIDNRPGAGGAIAVQALMASPPDGRTLLWGLASMAGIPMTQKAPPFQSLAELAPVTSVGRFAFGVFVHPDVPARTVAELVAHARSRSAPMACATGTLGEFMAAAQFLKATGIGATMVPYKGGAQLMPDLVSGRVQLNLGPVSSGLAPARAGKLRMLAVMTPVRSPLAPEVPTLTEAGLALGPLPVWQALFAPPRTPPETAARLAREVSVAMADAGLRSTFDQLALHAEAQGPAALAATVERDIEAWRLFVREHGVLPE